jgi:hypothetical protein
MRMRIGVALVIALTVFAPMVLMAQNNAKTSSKPSNHTAIKGKPGTVTIKRKPAPAKTTAQPKSSAARNEFMKQTGYPNGRPGYVIDHIVPLECGGTDVPSNMHWLTVAEAKAKDKTCKR